MQVYASIDSETTLDIDAVDLVNEAESAVESIIDEHIKPLVQRIMHLEKLAGMVHNEDGDPIDPEAEAWRIKNDQLASDERRRTVEKWGDAGLETVECAVEYIKLGWTEDDLREAWEHTKGLSADGLSRVINVATSLVQRGLTAREE